MARKEKVNRQNEQEAKFKALKDQLLHDEDGRLRDFYDYAILCLNELETLKKPEKIFSKTMKNKLKDQLIQNAQEDGVKVEDYVLYIAECLTEWTPVLSRWTKGEDWGLPMICLEDGSKVPDRDEIQKIWLKTVKQWWDEDSFPRINEGRAEGRTDGKGGTKEYDLVYERRDVILCLFMILGFTVKECDDFLEEMCLIKDSDEVRPLYALDFKECFFRWILLWNENHEEKISYKQACSYYCIYGTKLLEDMNERVPNVCKNIDLFLDYLKEEMKKNTRNAEERKPYEKRIKEYSDLKENCLRIWRRISNRRNAFYEQSNAENLKRLMALVAHMEKKLETVKKDPVLRNTQANDESKLQAFKRSVENTRVKRGTTYAWSELSRLADGKQKDFEESFKTFQNISVSYICEAYWRQYSLLNALTSQSEKNAEKNPLVKYSAHNKKNAHHFNILKDAMDHSNNKSLPFGVDGHDIQQMMKEYSNTRTILSNLMRPVRRQDADDRVYEESGCSSGVSEMMNAYHKWSVGENEDTPQSEFRRKKVLKMAIASGVEDYNGIKKVLDLSGKAEFQFLDRNEALVYLMTYYCEELKCMADDIKVTYDNLIKSGFNNSGWKEEWEKLEDYVYSKLPAEFEVEIPVSLNKMMRQETIPARDRTRLGNMLNDWSKEQNHDLIERIPVSLVERLKETDFISILTYANYRDKGKLEKIRQNFFYEPYTYDFKFGKKSEGDGKKTVKKQMDWLQVVESMYSAMKQIFTEEGVKQLFRFAYFRPNEAERDDMKDLLSEYLDGMDMEMIIKASEAQIHENLERFFDVVKASVFLNQGFSTLESHYILDQWYSMLVTLDYFDIDISEEMKRFNKYLELNLPEEDA